jgi:hypothetical protein
LQATPQAEAAVVDRGLNLERMILLIENTQANRSSLTSQSKTLGLFTNL